MNIERLKNAKQQTIADIQKTNEVLSKFEKDVKDLIAHIIDNELTDKLLDDTINEAIAENSSADKLDININFVIKIKSYELKAIVYVNHTRITKTYKTYDKSEYDEMQVLQTLFRYHDTLNNGNDFKELGFYDFSYIGYDKIMHDYIEPKIQNRLNEYGAKVENIQSYFAGDDNYVISIVIKNPV